MNDLALLARIEGRKLTTTPGLYVAAAITMLFTVISVATSTLLTGPPGSPPPASTPHVAKVLSVAALSSMVMLVLGILAIAGEHRHRTILATYLAQPRRGRVLAAKLTVLAGVGAVFGAVTFGLALAVAVPLLATKGVHHLPVDVASMWWGATLAGACYGLLGVGLGALTRNTVGAVIGGLAWVQIVEVGILQSVWPSVAKWLPTGAGVAVTEAGVGDGAGLLPPAAAAVVLLTWALGLSVLATRVSARRELR